MFLTLSLHNLAIIQDSKLFSGDLRHFQFSFFNNEIYLDNQERIVWFLPFYQTSTLLVVNKNSKQEDSLFVSYSPSSSSSPLVRLICLLQLQKYERRKLKETQRC